MATAKPRATATAPAAVSENQLKRNALGLPSAMAMSLAFISPTIGVIFISSLIAGKAGLSSPFIFIIGTLGIALMASTLAQFTRRITSAGTFYKFICQSFGTSTAFVAGMVLLLAYTLQSPLNTNLFGGFVSQTLAADFGIHIAWWILMLFIVVAVGALAWYSVHTSMRFDLAFVVAEVTVAGRSRRPSCRRTRRPASAAWGRRSSSSSWPSSGSSPRPRSPRRPATPGGTCRSR
jgi:amino acid transporter